MVISSKDTLGAQINIEANITKTELYFGECSSVFVVSIDRSKLIDFVLLTKNYDIFSQTIGTVTCDSKLTINNDIDLDKNLISSVYYDSLENIMKNTNNG